ncbi:hypothetical protein B0T25DRAFT_532716 [Lasiosphaeria hispida]|uniref:Uncharacterized protein n=1 Tax=Lasiosphaeria hispida TaxID=260671 RepID=A0AAJ0MHK9_9PEZI|nr:hypothetical protein B0T25DRAFT_532716 [Lasiosphaeria hispida]
MAPARSSEYHASPRSDLSTPNGPADNIQFASRPILTQIQEAKKMSLPQIITAQTKAAIPNPNRLSARTPVFPGSRRINGSISRVEFRRGRTSPGPVSESDSASLSRGEESSASSDEYGYDNTARSTKRPDLSLTRRKGNGRPQPSSRPLQQLRSYHSQYLRQYRSVTLSASPESGSWLSENVATRSKSGARDPDLWSKVEEQRDRVAQLRARKSEKRAEVRDLRRQKGDIDNGFMNLFRPLLQVPQLTSNKRVVVPSDKIDEGFKKMQSAYNDYYDAEDRYESLETELDREESELYALEAELYAEAKQSYSPMTMSDADDDEYDEFGDDADDDDDDDRLSRVSLLGISGERQEDIHPLYQALLDAAGERELAREYVEELRVHREGILYELEMGLHLARVRTNQGNLLSEEELKSLKSSLANIPGTPADFEARFGVPIEIGDLDFLQDFEHQEKLARQTLDETEHEVERLRELCMEKGVMRKHATYNEEFVIFSGSKQAALLPEGNVAIESPPRAGSKLAHPRFPILLSNPSHVLELLSPMAALEQAMKLPKDDPNSGSRRAECMKELGIDNLMKKAENKPDYINQWLIHRLRTSPMEIELMFSISERWFKIVNPGRWQEEVLYFWRKDDLARLAPQQFQGPLTPRDELGFDDLSLPYVNSDIGRLSRARSEEGDNHHHRHQRKASGAQSQRSLS